MTPTVGRIVHYYAPRGEPHGAEIAPVPALVCEVESDTELTLYVLDKHKGARFVTGAKEVAEAPQSGRWAWPPMTQTAPKLKSVAKDYEQAPKGEPPVSA